MDQRYPEPTVGAFILNGKGEMLFVRSYKWPGVLTVPGGHIELGEDANTAVVREAKEEVGIDLKPIKLLRVHEAIYPKGFYKKRHYIFLDILCLAKSNKVKIDGDEIQGYVWMKPWAALKLKLDSFTRATVLEYIRKGK